MSTDTESPIGRQIATNRHGVTRYIAICEDCGGGFAPCYLDDTHCGCWAEMRDAMDDRAAQIVAAWFASRKNPGRVSDRTQRAL